MRNGATKDRGGVQTRFSVLFGGSSRNDVGNEPVSPAEPQISQISFTPSPTIFFFFLQSLLGTESKCSEDVFQRKSHK